METIHIVGAGPAGLMAAQQFAQQGNPVIVYDHKSAPARKFLVAGNGGFNLTHSESIDDFLNRYDSVKTKEIVQGFNNEDTIAWLHSIGVSTYIGSSGKIFPSKGFKPIEVLQKWLEVLRKLNVKFKFGYYLVDFNATMLVFSTKNEIVEISYKRAVFAFGGRSWSKTGSDGQWIQLFNKKNIEVTSTGPSNSGLELTSPYTRLAGQPLKNIRLFNSLTEKYGELVFSEYGIEGSAVYYMNSSVRQHPFPQSLYIDLKPSYSDARIKASFKVGKKNTEVLKKVLKLEPTKILLLKTLSKEIYTDAEKLSSYIKRFPVEVNSFRPIEEVISTYGGVAWEELHNDLSLRKFPDIQCCGEMLDWDAPTGGYLLQACFATGYYVAKG